MIASVIVDVKVKNLNRPFSYIVPKYFVNIIEKGMRVKVPFGYREVLGYVIDIHEDNEQMELKPLSDVLDIIPSLTEELLELAIYMSKETSSYLISCIQAMLPPAIKAKYQKKVVKLGKTSSLDKYFLDKFDISFDLIEKKDYSILKKAILNKEVDIKYDIKDRVKIKYDSYLSFIKDENVRGAKQRQVIDYLKEKNRVLRKEVINELSVSHQTIKSLIKKNVIEEIKEEAYRDPYKDYDFNKIQVRHKLNKEQVDAYKQIISSVDKKNNEIYLLHGVTGSGKTEVYLNVIEYTLKLSRNAIMLVPEISLTPQIVYQFKTWFGDSVAVLHSGLSLGEKYDEWRRIRRGEVKIVVGARSAIFAPLDNIGVIIIDEEHETTYKQDEMPKYHAIEIAKKRAENYQSPLVLGSATPSLESYARAVKNVYKLLELPKRATNTLMPNTQIINMADEFKSGNFSIVSDKLYNAINERLAKKEQIILLLNRRGYDNFVMCRSCGYTATCQNCDISLTYHKAIKRLKCHYCGYEKREPTKCPNCGSIHIKGFGYGTQKVEEELFKLFPQARIIRMDYDTTANKGDHDKIIKAFRNKKADILLGTQMIAKGLDFEDVTLVGVLSADTVLKLPDYKSSEKTFQLLTQVSGRAGRHKANSDVIIQTYNPKHYAIFLASRYNYKAFFNQEMKIRKLGKYSPYYYLTKIVITSDVFQETLKEANKIVKYIMKNLSQEAIILGPVVPQIKRLNNLYSSQIIIKYKREANLEKVLESTILSYQNSSVNVIVDRYPNFLL